MEKQLISKLGLQNHKNLLEKTTELLRLLEVKSAPVTSNVSDYGKITICIDLAADLLGITTDLIDMIKESGMKKMNYEIYKRTFQKLLDLNKPPGINEICVHLKCVQVARKANELLNIYKEYINEKNEYDIDLSHPQYAAMAVFQACKMSNVKILKPKILKYSYLRPSQWVRLEQQWDKFMKLYEDNITNIKSISKVANFKDKNSQIQNSNFKQKHVEEIEDYEIWKARILKKAKGELQQMKERYSDKDISTMELDDSD